MAKVAGLSKYHVWRMFAAEVGHTPHAYLLGVRIESAKVLLAEGNSVASVAAATGFCDQSHLNKHFKRVLGKTPSEYRRHACKP